MGVMLFVVGCALVVLYNIQCIFCSHGSRSTSVSCFGTYDAEDVLATLLGGFGGGGIKTSLLSFVFGGLPSKHPPHLLCYCSIPHLNCRVGQSHFMKSSDCHLHHGR